MKKQFNKEDYRQAKIAYEAFWKQVGVSAQNFKEVEEKTKDAWAAAAHAVNVDVVNKYVK